MKKPFILGTLVLASFVALAQEQPLVVIHKNYTDSLSAHKSNPWLLPEEVFADRRALLLTATSRGKVYNMQPDNMPVLDPDMLLVEKMPGSSTTFTPAPPSKMPNPLYKPRRKGTN